MHGEIMRRVHSTIVNVKEYQRHFKKYSYLWTDDKTEFMKQFLQYGRFLSTEEMELYADYELQECSPQLEHFKKQVKRCRNKMTQFELSSSGKYYGFLLIYTGNHRPDAEHHISVLTGKPSYTKMYITPVLLSNWY